MTTRNGFVPLVGFFSILLAAFGAAAQTTNALSGAEIRGRQLVQQLLEQQPTESFTNTGFLKIRNAKGKETQIPLVVETVVTTTNWAAFYVATTTNGEEKLSIIYRPDQAGELDYVSPEPLAFSDDVQLLVRPFAGSDFSIGDLDLQFLHWPGQKILRGDTARGRLCKVLESTNPDPSTNGYSRVLCWIDNEALGIVEAKAYDAQGRLLKEFYPKDIKKVDGQWQVGSMEIDNVQTSSRTWLKFDLKAK
jgi:hypothetical protein